MKLITRFSTKGQNYPNHKLWDVFDEMTYKKRYVNIRSLSYSLVEAVVNFPVEILRNGIDERIQRLKDCAKVKGSHYEK